MKQIEPTTYFSDGALNESLLYYLEYDRPAKQLKMVIVVPTWPKSPPEPWIDYRYLLFDGIGTYSRTGNVARALKSFEIYDKNLIELPEVDIYALHSEVDDEDYRLRFTAGGYGDFEFTYLRLFQARVSCHTTGPIYDPPELASVLSGNPHAWHPFGPILDSSQPSTDS